MPTIRYTSGRELLEPVAEVVGRTIEGTLLHGPHVISRIVMEEVGADRLRTEIRLTPVEPPPSPFDVSNWAPTSL